MNRFGLAFAFAGALCLSSLLIFPGCHGAGGTRPIPCNAGLSVFCANILYCDPTAEPKPAFIERRDRLIDLLEQMQPDVVAIQEACDCLLYGPEQRTVQVIVESLSERGLNYDYSFWVSEKMTDLWQEGLAFVWNTDRLDVAPGGIECVHLSESYFHIAMMIRKSLCRMTVLPKSPEGTRMECPPVEIFNTHLDARYDEVRDAQAIEIAGIFEESLDLPESKAVFVGDLNGREMEPFFEPQGWRLDVQNHVDYILTLNLPDEKVVEARVVDLKETGISDHDGLWIEILWP